MDLAATVERTVDLSVVVPFFNEEENVGPMFDAIESALGSTLVWQCVFVDDGSTDLTASRLRQIAEVDPRVRAIILARNYGQTPAMVAGIQYSDGQIIVTMDGDLQNDPTDIPDFLAGIEEGYDIVVGRRVKRQDKLITRKIPSWIANRLIGYVTGLRISDNGCSLKAYRAKVIKNIPLYSEMHRFIPAMSSMAGSKIKEIPVKHHARIHGESKYGLSRVFKVLGDLVVVRTLLSSVGRPARIFHNVALVSMLLSTVLFLLAVVDYFSGQEYLIYLGVSGLLFMFSAFSFGLGLISTLIYRTTDLSAPFLAKITKKIMDATNEC